VIGVNLDRRAFAKAVATGLGLKYLTGCNVEVERPEEALSETGGQDADSALLGPGADLGGRGVFSPGSAWNRDISGEPVDPLSALILRRVGLDKPLHPDFGTVYQGAPNGIPYVVVPGTQPKVPVRFTYAGESDPGPYPIPPDAPIEGGSDGKADRHVIIIDRDNWMLYELFDAHPDPSGKGWSAGSGAIFHLKNDLPRKAGWTSADAAGLPIFPGLARFEEVVTREVVRHAFRFTVAKTRRGYVDPARHFASSDPDPTLPPMGMRVRLKADYDLTGFPPQARAILGALKVYGMILADNGGDWFLSGAPDRRWNNEELAALKQVKVRDFEVVRMGAVVTR
jgi:hypothetical protein